MNNSLKFYHDMISRNVNLDSLTCMPKFEDTHKRQMGPDLIKENSNLNMTLNRIYTIAPL
jgi:hypothetical protein